ncbi:peptidoglycan DD-metalloendopeptidase family protein [Microbacteriaceae bacterium K1510]|nr:peptidoglycan DD-metalloendopeptidase family protein [Microbacteriaceae bacterium K1510]
MTRAIIFILALLTAAAAAAEEMKTPRLSTVEPDWQMATVNADGGLDALNAAAATHFPGIDKSSVPVLLPFDKGTLAGFQPTGFFQAGPAGYDAAFSLRTADIGDLSDIRYRDPVYVLMSGLRFTYDLDGPALPEGQPVKDLDALFPGITRTLHEFYVRYSFSRYGVTYVAAIYCRDIRPRPRILSCNQADRVAERFLRALKLAGGNPAATGPTTEQPPIARPDNTSSDFTYFSPGSLIPGSGRRPELPGRSDYTVYARLRFPMKEAPAFANSQSFNNWGDCDFTGRSPRRLGRKGMSYSCKVNGLPLVFDESAGRNYSYPWRDNFCEHRNFDVGQCPAGQGHQGQDIRPSNCAQINQGADRCEPHLHEVVAVHDGMILRAPKQEAVFLFINTADTHMRVRYMHMSPKRLDADGVLSGRTVKAGEQIGLVANYNEYERGTTNHLHFDMQVPTRIGWVFVNPYMTLVASYEQLIGARGTEIKNGDPEPPVATVPPVILQPSIVRVPAAAQGNTMADGPKDAAVPQKSPEPKPAQISVSGRAESQTHHATSNKEKKPRKRHVRRRRKHSRTAEE